MFQTGRVSLWKAVTRVCSSFESYRFTTNALNYSLRISKDQKTLYIEPSNPSSHLSHSIPVHVLWLRDSCSCPTCYHDDTHQRLLDPLELDETLRLVDIQSSGSNFHVTFSDHHTSRFETLSLVETLEKGRSSKSRNRTLDPCKKVYWGKDMESSQAPPMVEFNKMMESDEGVQKCLEHIHTYGFTFVEGVPPTAQDTRRLAERISFIKETFYGTLWEFGSRPTDRTTKNTDRDDLATFSDMAYTEMALKSHTDTTYFSEPMGLQMLHLLQQTGTGGQSQLVDGFYVAQALQRQHPDAYRILSTVPVPSIYLGNQGSYVPEAMPILRHSHITGDLYQIRYNNEDRHTMSHLAYEETESFYRAFCLLTLFLRDASYEYKFQLRPGTPVIFDNWRVLHGRSAIQGHRHMAGCYIGHDEWTSRLRRLRDKR